MKEVSAEEWLELKRKRPEIRLIDVREPSEYDQANIEGELIPLGDLPEALAALDPDESYVIMCRSGARSGRAVGYMEQMGFSDVANLEGGILAYKARIDPSLKVT